MAADVIPSNFDNSFRKIDDRLTVREKIDYSQAMKQRYLGKINILDEKDFYHTQKELHRLGAINAEDGLSLLSGITKNAAKNEEIQGIIKEYKPEGKNKIVGRTDDIKAICKKLGKVNVPGINLFGESGVGKTTLAQEVAKNLDGFKAITVDLRGIVEMKNVYFHILNGFELLAWDKDKDRILLHLKSNLSTKTLLILDNIEQFLTQEDDSSREDFLEFVRQMISSESCKSGNFKLVMTSRQELKDTKLKGKFFSDYHEVQPLSDDVSKNLILSPEKKSLEALELNEKAEMLEITKLCKNIPYLLQGVKHLLREGFTEPSEIIQRLKLQLTTKAVPAQYVCIAEQFESIPNEDLKHLAVKISLLRRPFSVKTAMKIAGLSSEYLATIDLELLAIHKIISRVDADKKQKYDVHALFQDFVKDHLCEKEPVYKEQYSEGEKHFFEHFSGKISKLAQLLDKDFVKAYPRIEVNRANFDLAIDISKQNREDIDILLHSDQHNQSALIGILFEVLKDVNERKKLYRQWAETAEKTDKWLGSANLRCWQALQGEDIEGTRDANQALKIAEDSLKKAEKSASSEQIKAGKSLLLHCQGRVKCLEATNMAVSTSKKKDKKRDVLLEEGIEYLKEALQLRKETFEEEVNTMNSRTLNLIGNCYMELNEPDTAETFYRDALEMKRKLVGTDTHWEIPTYYNQLSQVHERRGMKIEKSFFGSFRKKKFKSEYKKAVEWMEKALKLEQDLGVGDTQHTDTFQRNLANSLIGIGEYDKSFEYATKCYEARLERYGEHPETVNILYLMGIIHEWRKDIEAACKSYESAFEMEEKLPSYNHSRCSYMIRSRLKKMYKKLKRKEKEKELQIRIDEIEKREEEMELKQEDVQLSEDFDDLDTDFPFDEEVYINVDHQGGTYHHSINGFVVFVPPNCVSEPTRVKCESKPTLPSPANSTEHLVSSVVRLGPSSIQLGVPLVMTMLHCGPGEKEGYETIVKVFNEESQVWEEKEEIQHASQRPAKIPEKLQYIEVQLTKLTAVAIVSRLIKDTFEVPVSGCVVKSSVCPDITLLFPEGAVDRTIKGALQVLPIPDHLMDDPVCVPCPVLLFSGFKDVMFSKPVHISVPISSRSQAADVRLLRLDVTRNPPFLWEDITNDDIKPKVDGNIVELQVQRFCGLWLWSSADHDVVDKAYKLFGDLYADPPCAVSFAAYQKKQCSDSSKFQLKLICVDNDQQEKYTDYWTKQDFHFLEASTADQKMRINDKAFLPVNNNNIDPSKWRTDFFLEFFSKNRYPCQKPLNILTCIKTVNISFYREKDPNRHQLCELELDKIDEDEDEDEDFEKPWVEYRGIDFETLRDLPEDIVSAIIPCFTHYPELKDRIFEWEKRWNIGGVEKLLSLLPKVPFQQVNDKLDELAKSECSQPNKYVHLAYLLRLLKIGHRLVEDPLANISSEVRNTIDKISSKITIKDCIKLERKLGLTEKTLDKLYSPSKVLTYWSKLCTTGKIEDLFNALRACGCKKAAKELAKTITELAKAEEKGETQKVRTELAKTITERAKPEEKGETQKLRTDLVKTITERAKPDEKGETQKARTELAKTISELAKAEGKGETQKMITDLAKTITELSKTRTEFAKTITELAKTI